MRLASRLGLLALVATAACSKGDSSSILYVSVTAPATMPAASQLIVNLSGAVSDTQRFPEVNAGDPIKFVPAATFVLVIPRSLSGDLLVAVDAVDAASHNVGYGEGRATIKVGGRVDVAISLQAQPTDGGGPAPDGGVPDDAPRADVPLDAGTGGIGGGGGATGIRGTGGAAAGGSSGRPSSGGASGAGGVTAAGGRVGTGGAAGGTSGRDDGGRRDAAPDGESDLPKSKGTCGNGLVEVEAGESCDCGDGPATKPANCPAPNGVFYGDGKGCSLTCTKEPTCQDGSGSTQACSAVCGDGYADPTEGCDDGNQVDGDGCSRGCQVESGFACTPQTFAVDSPCQSGTGNCLTLAVNYRDFQGENAPSMGHPDFPFLGYRFNGSSKPTTICVPNSSGPVMGVDATARCWGIVGPKLLGGKPQPGPTTTCACQFTDWFVGSDRIPGGYTADDSPLSDGNGGFQGGTAGTEVNTVSSAGAYSGSLVGYTTSGGPIWRGTVPAFKNAGSFKQWWSDDSSVNSTFRSFLELTAAGSNTYRLDSVSHLRQGGFFPLDALNPSQATLCNLWPYWNRGNGTPIWSSGCKGDQYLIPPDVTQGDCPSGTSLVDGCWVTQTPGAKHDYYFTMEARYVFAYDANGVDLTFFSDRELWVFVNGVMVLDLGGIHTPLPGRVTLKGDPGDAQVVEGGCLDGAGNIVGVTAGSKDCRPTSSTAVASTPDDFRVRTVQLGLTSGKLYELAIFGTNRQPVDSYLQVRVSGFTAKRSVCSRN